ncbi:MAG: response regulator [Candidatus Saccharicenans sp.]|nr:MAG: response regulator [Candidatus Aminicenantes bacterium]HEK85180.1 response regulator [Candidatus Aminicenantes bacterium]
MPLKALVVDDDPVSRTLVSRALEEKGFSVLKAADGLEALALTEREKPEVVIADMLLPKMDGMNLCLRIKENPELAGIKVILMTAVYKSPSLRAEALSLKADAYLEKPISAEEILKVIDSVI